MHTYELQGVGVCVPPKGCALPLPSGAWLVNTVVSGTYWLNVIRLGGIERHVGRLCVLNKDGALVLHRGQYPNNGPIDYRYVDVNGNVIHHQRSLAATLDQCRPHPGYLACGVQADHRKEICALLWTWNLRERGFFVMDCKTKQVQAMTFPIPYTDATVSVDGHTILALKLMVPIQALILDNPFLA